MVEKFELRDSSMLQAFKIIQIVLAILLVIVVLMQQKSSGLGLAFGGDSNVYRSRRGIEKFLHWTTVVMVVLFALIALATVFFSEKIT